MLEHLGSEPSVFLQIMQEIYRVSQHDCTIKIEVPHHKHVDFYTDPTHCRIITPETLGMFSRSACQTWIEAGAANTPLALICNVDFAISSVNYLLDKGTLEALSAIGISIDAHENMLSYANIFDNLVKQVSITMKVIK